MSTAETKMLRAVITGYTAWCGPSPKDDDHHNDPSSTEEWGPEREIRADLLRWLSVDKAAFSYVDPEGIKLHGAKISTDLNLSGAVLRFPILARHSRFTGDIWLFSAELPFLSLSGSSVRAIRADQVKIKGSIFLREGFSAQGEVTLIGAQIGGSLECNAAFFKNPPKKDIKGTGRAFNAQGVRVNGNFNLHTSQSEGEVWLTGAQIGGGLDCGGAIFNNPALKDVPGSGTALIAQDVNVNGPVFLRMGFQAHGEVSFHGAKIGSDLDCHGGTFKNARQEGLQESGTALNIENVNVTGNGLLCGGFNADGRLDMLGARFGGDLACYDASFDEILAPRLKVQRILFWFSLKNVERTSLDLGDAFAGSIIDDSASWPSKGKLALDGFTYGRIANGPKDSKGRLEWLSRQASFTPQPYRQLAKVLREEGDDPGGRHVLYEMEKRKHREARHGWLARLWNLIFRGTIGYGIYPRRALWCLLLLIVVGWGTYWDGYSSHAITPTNKEAYEVFQKNGEPPRNYQHFSALIYSTEHCFPLVNLGQKDAWNPDPNQLGLSRFLRVFRWGQILLGWALATFFVAGVTGIARKD